MWFKQLQLFQIADAVNFSVEDWAAKLEPLSFRPCMPSMMMSAGWVSPIDEDDAPLVQAINGNIMLCLQIEEKILPSIVIRQELVAKIKEIEKVSNRKLRQKEKYALKDEIIQTLLPRAFSRLTRVYGYVDTKNNWLVLGNTNDKKVNEFVSLFKKAVTENIHVIQFKNLSATITYWLKNQKYPTIFAIEKSCMLQDPSQQNRVIRCQQQNLFAESIQALINDGCEVKQLAVTWHDRVTFTLQEDFSLSAIKFQDEITEQAEELEPDSVEQQFNADFFIMTECFASMLKDLLNVFVQTKNTETESRSLESVAEVA